MRWKRFCPSWSLIQQGSGPKSFEDDLCTGRGVVLGRAATTLRSIETHFVPLDIFPVDVLSQ